ncbi:hypothetical protein AAHE18_03G176500 [Arachis hypogaea]
MQESKLIEVSNMSFTPYQFYECSRSGGRYERTLEDENCAVDMAEDGLFSYHHRRHQPHARKRVVEVVEYQRTPEYGTHEVIYKGVETDPTCQQQRIGHGHFGY